RRGMIHADRFFGPGEKSTIFIESSSNVGVRDVTIVRSAAAGVSITDSSSIVLANIREINTDRFSDGIDVNSSNDVLVDNAFLRTSDDSIAVYASTPWGAHGGTRNVTVRNSSLWPDVAHPILVGTFGNPA